MLTSARTWTPAALGLPALFLASTAAHGFEEVWRARFRPSPGGNEEGLHAAADAAGNVYVAGTAESLDDSSYYGTYTVTLKYSPGGEVLWVKYMHSEFTTLPVALSVDASGVYVAASWDDDDVDNRARAFKYDAEGQDVWLKQFNGVDRDVDDEPTAYPKALVPHSDGGAFFLCRSYNGRTQVSVVLRYGPDGKELWRAERADGGSSAMALHPEGGVILSGWSESGIHVTRYAEDGTGRLFAHANIGVSMLPEAIAVAPDGTLHVAGSSGHEFGTVVKLDPAGNLLRWEIAAAGETVRIAGLALLPGGELVMAGSAGPWREPSGFVLELDSEMRSLWRADFGGRDVADVRDMAVGSDGIVHLAGSIGTSGSRDYWTAALDASGAVLREIRRDGGGEDIANALALDPAGNTHITGASFGRNGPDMLTVSHDPAGDERWASRFEHPEETFVHHVAVDGEGNTVVAGASGNYGDLVKYDRAGAVLWAVSFPHEAEDESPYDLTIDPAGNSFVAAGELRKLDPAGKTLWVHAGPYSFIEAAPGGELYASGREPRRPGVLAKLDASGHELWRRSPADEVTIAALALDAQGLPVLALGAYDDRTVLKYDEDGEVLWSVALPRGLYGPSPLAVDPSGSVYVLGSALVKLDPSGNHLWSRSGFWRDMALDGDGNIHGLHVVMEADSVVKLTPQGEEVWKTAVPGLGFRIVLDGAGSAFVPGLLPSADPGLYFMNEIDPRGRLVDQVTFGPAYCCVTAPRLAFHPGGDLIVSAPSSSEYLTLRLRRSGATEFIRGDANGDGALLMDDAVGSLDWLFRGGPEPACGDAADSNDDGLIDITDAVYSLSHLFLGGPSPPPPYPGKGRDATPDSLACGS